MPRVLIVSPHFPPSNTPDLHRVRLLLPFLAENGWQAEVLAISAAQVAAPLDPWLGEGLPDDVPVHRVNALGSPWTRIPGLGSLGFRALPALARAGDRLLSRTRFDLVYFSTTVFETHILGPRWKRKFGVPFAMDYQDPWVNDYYRDHPEVTPPGGRLKHAVSSGIHRWMEPWAVRRCAGITSVSPEYPKQLSRRYPWFESKPCLVQGFPAAARDFDRLAEPAPSRCRHLVDFDDGRLHWLYVGRGGADMAKSVRAILRSLRDHAPESLKERLQVHFIGTSYAPAGTARPSLAPLAAELGVEGLVREHPERIGYSDTLSLIRRADALLVPGSDDAAYTASKIYPYLLARRPLLAVFHARSSVTELIARVGGGTCVPFEDGDAEEVLSDRIARAWLEDRSYLATRPLDVEAFEPYTDRACAARLAAFFAPLAS